ncbi:MAG: hypothetical protein OSB26_02630 [Woeseiaceae bacterium]|jgi:hypothetical protein|nr:hypothetical protein [Woeseiaceae bacterium]
MSAQTTYDVVTVDVSGSHWRATVRTASIGHTNRIVVTDDHQIDVGHKRMGWLAVV